MRSTFLRFSPPSVSEEDIAEVVDTLRSDWLSTGPKTARFERELADYTGAAEGLALNSCTAALHVALIALDIGPGDEVITTPITFAASVNVIEHVGATPVMVDVEPDTLNIDPAAIEAAVTPRTRAIIPVHFAGHPVDLDAINAIARRHNLHVIEDAAHAVGAFYKSKPIGSSGNPVAFSFYATKNLTTGEGGMLMGAPELLQRARVIGLHGMSRDAWQRYDQVGSWFYEITLPGFKYNMSDIQASLGLGQLRRMAAIQARRREIAERYTAAFSGLPALQVPVERSDVGHAWHLYVLRLNPGQLTIDRAEFITQLSQRNIGCSVHFIPVHMHPYYRDKYGFAPDAFPVAHENYQRILSIPLNVRMSDEDVGDVIEAVTDVTTTFAR